jgi:hypothetical protein
LSRVDLLSSIVKVLNVSVLNVSVGEEADAQGCEPSGRILLLLQPAGRFLTGWEPIDALERKFTSHVDP